MRITARNALTLGMLTALLPALAAASPVRVDFVGTLSFVGGVAGNSAPPGYSFADASVGDPIFGWFEYDNNLANWSSVDFDFPGVVSSATDTTAPIPASFFLQLPLSGKTISPADAINESQLRARYSARVQPFVQFTQDVDHGPLPSTGGLLRSFDFRVVLDSGSPAALDSYVPSVIKLDEFASRSLTFTTQGTSGFSIVEDFTIAATISTLPGMSDATGSLFEGFGTFEGEDASGGPLGWDVSGPGTVERVPSGGGGGGNVVRLTTGSPVSLSTLINTPFEAFELSFLYEFLSATGVLEVLLGGETIASIDAPGTLGGGLSPFVVLVDDPALLGQSGLELAFLFDDTVAGSQLLLDNVAAVVVPLPAAMPMFAAAALAGLAGFRRPRRGGAARGLRAA